MTEEEKIKKEQSKLSPKIPLIITGILIFLMVCGILFTTSFFVVDGGLSNLGVVVILAVFILLMIGAISLTWFVYLILLAVRRKRAGLKDWYLPLIILIVIFVGPNLRSITWNAGYSFVDSFFERKEVNPIILNDEVTINQFNNRLLGSSDKEYKIKDTNIKVKNYYVSEYDIYQTEVFIDGKEVINEFAEVYIDLLDNNYIFYLQGQGETEVKILGYTKEGRLLFRFNSDQIGTCNYLEVVNGRVSIYKKYSNEGAGVCELDKMKELCPDSIEMKVYQKINFKTNEYELADTNQYECTIPFVR